MIILTCLVVFSTVSFLSFGIGCFLASQMKTEFIRYGLAKWRLVVGALQIMGAVSLFFGYFYLSVLGLIAALGLTILMILGFIVRLKIKDTASQSAPSLIFAIINGYITIMLLKNIYFL